MRMDPFDVFKTYLAIKLHFTTKQYDYNLYGGSIKNTSLEKFNERKDKMFFHKLASKYRESEMVDFMVANLKSGESVWVGKLLTPEAHKEFTQFTKRKQAIGEFFKSDLEKLFSQVDEPIEALQVIDGQNPLILKEIYSGELGVETLIILNDILPIEYFSAIDSKLQEDILWPDTRNKAMKLRSFLKYSKPKMKNILKKFISV